MPTRLPIHPNMSMDVINASANLGSQTLFQAPANESRHVTRITWGVFATMREESHGGGDWTGKSLPQCITVRTPSRSSLQAEHDLKCSCRSACSAGLSAFSR